MLKELKITYNPVKSKLIKKLSLQLLMIFVLFGCDVNSPENLIFNSPKCIISNKSELIVSKDSWSKMDFTIANNGDGPTAYNISIYVKLKKGNYIVDENSAYFGSLLDRESKSKEVWFTKVKSSNEYDQVDIYLYWEDAEGKYYDD